MMVLRFIGCMYLLEPVKICCTIILFALSDGWNGSQNAYRSLFGHKFESGVQSPKPLYGPWPQHAILEVTNPTQPKHTLIISDTVNSRILANTCNNSLVFRAHARSIGNVQDIP